MGLLDRMVRRGIADAVGNVLREKIDEAMQQGQGSAAAAPGQGEAGYQPGAAQPGAYSGGQAVVPGGYAQVQASEAQGSEYPPKWKIRKASADSPATHEQRAYFAQILAADFPEYIVRTDVPVEELGGEGKAYEFAMFKDGYCAAVISLAARNGNCNWAYIGGREAAEQAGVPFVNFFLHLPNERSYVVNRIRSRVR